MALATAQGFTLWVAVGTTFRGWALAMQGQGEEGRAQVCQGVAAWRATGAVLHVPYFCTLLADVCDHWATRKAASRRWPRRTRWWSSMRNATGKQKSAASGASCSCGSRGHRQAEAETWLQRALDVARRQEAKSLELRAAMSLSRLWQRQGKRAAARELLAPVYGWFTEGFDTADLQDARALLEELAVEGPQQ